MNRAFIFKILLTVIFILTLFPVVQASVPIEKILLTNTANYQQQDEKNNKDKKKPKTEKGDIKQEPNKPDIREVPKARKQSRPPVVVKPNIKAKPIKVIRPNIKRP